MWAQVCVYYTIYIYIYVCVLFVFVFCLRGRCICVICLLGSQGVQLIKAELMRL